MENNQRNLLNGIVLGKSLKLKKEMEDLGKEKPEQERNQEIAGILGTNANQMAEEERADSVRSHAKGIFEP